MNTSVEAKIKAVALNVRKIREFRNYTQEYLALKLGITQNAYSKIELGYTKMTLERLMQIAQILEVETEVILSRKTEDMISINTDK
jgi:transcriptional regulator with XRE-family HTH domain